MSHELACFPIDQTGHTVTRKWKVLGHVIPRVIWPVRYWALPTGHESGSCRPSKRPGCPQERVREAGRALGARFAYRGDEEPGPSWRWYYREVGSTISSLVLFVFQEQPGFPESLLVIFRREWPADVEHLDVGDVARSRRTKLPARSRLKFSEPG